MTVRIAAAAMVFFGLAMPAMAQSGWVCTEGGTLTKYRRIGHMLRVVDDPFTKMMEQTYKSLGQSMEYEELQILVDNDDGLIAVGASARPPNGRPSNVNLNSILIDKRTGFFRSIAVSASAESIWNQTGSCVAY